MKKLSRILAVLLVVCMILSVLPTAFAAENSPVNPFTDVKEGSWYYDYVLKMVDMGIIKGMTPTTFEPDGELTRAQVTVMLYRMAGEPEVEKASSFTDVKAGKWYSDAIAWAEANKIVNGMTPTTFEPDGKITRAQLVTMLYRMAGEPAVEKASSFTDVKAGAWYSNAIAWAEANKIVNGMTPTTFEPDGLTTRAQAAKILCMFSELAVSKKTIILHSNDVHGAIEGYAYIAGMKKVLEDGGVDVILADAGDYSQGTTCVSLSKGANAVDMMNLVGYDVATLGNHEFDYGAAQMFENLSKAEFKVVCSDVLKDGKAIFDPYTIIDKGGVKVAFVGLETPEAQTKANPALIQGLTFLTDSSDPALWANTQATVDAAKAEGADIVVALAHLGVDAESAPYTSYDLYKNVTGIDFVIDGHSHSVMEQGANGEPIQSTGTAFANVGWIVINNATKAIEDNGLLEIDKDIPTDEAVAAAAQKIIDDVNAEYGAKFAESLVDLNGAKAPNGNRDSETNNGDLITDAMLWCVTEQYSGSITEVPAENIVAITNGGGIRAAINKGDVTKNDIFTVLPFGNTVAVVYVTGAELLEALEASTYCTPEAVGGFPQIAGMKIVIDTNKAYDANAETYPGSTYYGPASINRVTIEEVNGKPFDPEAKYAVVTNNFCAGGGDTYYAFAAATSQFDTGYTLDAVVMDYITEKLGGVIGEDYAAPQGRITVKTEPEAPIDGELFVPSTKRDGVEIPTYVTLPENYDPAQTYDLVMLIHGHGGNHNEWGGFDPITDGLAAEGVIAVTQDFSGCGDSKESFRLNTMTNMKNDVLDVLAYMNENYNIGTVGAMGYSMGGRIALELTAEGLYSFDKLEFVAPAEDYEDIKNLFGGHDNWDILEAEANEKGYVEYTTIYATQELSKEWFADLAKYPDGLAEAAIEKFDGESLTIYALDDQAINPAVSQNVADIFGSPVINTRSGGHSYSFYVNDEANHPIICKQVNLNTVAFFTGGELKDYYEPDKGELDGKVVILHSNDVHGAVAGYAYMAGLKADAEAEGAEVILVDAGDYSQGTTNVSLSKGANAVDMMNLTGYDVATLGNHEFDYGAAQLAENLSKAEFKVICSNILEEGESIYDPYTIIDKDGVKIAFIGLETPEAQTKANPALIQGLTFLTNETDPTLWANTQAQVDAAKAEGADIVIALAHLGVDESSQPYTSYDLCKNVTGIDFVIDGHSHTVMDKGADGQPIQSTGTAFANIGCIIIDKETKAIEDNGLITIDEDTPKDEAVAAAAQKIIDDVNAEYGAKFAESKVDLNGEKAPNGNRDSETNNGDLITDAMIWCVTEQYPGSITEVPAENIVAITNGGGIRAAVAKGDVTKNDILTVLPFGNTVTVVYVTGAELLEALEASTFCTPVSLGGFPQVAGVKFSIDLNKDYDANAETYPGSTYYGPASINRVTITEVNGKPFDSAAKYAIVTNDFCAGGGDTYYAFAAATSQFDTGYTLDTVVMDYITEKLGGVIGEDYADPQGRITVIPKEEVTEWDRTVTIGGTTLNVWFTKYGNTYCDCTEAHFTGTDDNGFGFQEGDIVTVKFLDQAIDLPVGTNYSDVDSGTPMIKINKDGYIEFAVNMGNFGSTYGLVDIVKGADGVYTITPKEGVTFPVAITFELKEAQGYAAELAMHRLTRTNNREDYADLSDAEFANFRQVTTTGMGDHLYRGSSPVNPEIGRNTYADAAIEDAGVTVIMNLADSEAIAAGYEGFSDSYYAGQNVIYLNLGVDFTAADFKAGLANGLKFFAANEGTYYVHCTEGKDRAGFVNALLECLMGATADEVVADYMVTYYNYYGVTTTDERYAPIANSNIVKTLQTAFGISDLYTADLAAEAAEYIKEIGLTDAEVAALKANLGNSTETDGYILVNDVADLADGDAFVFGATKDGTTYGSGAISGKFLDSVTATLTDDVLSGDGLVEITLEETTGGWYLKIGDSYINTTAAKALTFDETASTVWTISIADGLATVTAGSYGRFLYNVTSPRFLNYTSNTTVSMLLPSIYKAA